MRLLYLYTWVCLQYALRLYFKRVSVRNQSHFRRGRTIFVCNHQGSFMDPLLIATFRKPIIYFMVRADVFNKFTERIFWSAHMLPIYRQRDGGDSIEKNQAVFDRTNTLLAKKNNILIFGEGFTHDRIQRRLHPIKKGPARIGFSALIADGWQNDIYMQGLGINYADFNLRGSEVLVDAGVPICLNDFKEQYLANPSRTISEITQKIENSMRTLIPDVKDPDWSDFHEDIMMFTRKGIHPRCFEPTTEYEERWKYALRLAKWIDAKSEEALHELLPLKASIERYKLNLKEAGVHENERYEMKSGTFFSLRSSLLCMLTLPFSLLGLVHTALPIHLIKKWVEKKFKRQVYWGSTKMVLAFFIIPLINLPVIFLLPRVLPFDPIWNWVFSGIYFLSLGVFAWSYLKLQALILKILRYYKLKNMDLETHTHEYERILQQIENTISL